MSSGPRYEIKELIAAGGMAQVYRGESAGIEGFRKKVAIKRVLPKLSANQEFINMFLDEARLCAYLNHSRCVQVFDIGQGADSHFIVMEYVDGADLKAVQQTLAKAGQTMPTEVACLIAQQICEGLAYAHSAKDHNGTALDIVHRDISPHNVLMTRHGEVKLVDFGLARASSHLTEEDEDIVKGKFGYLAPEVTMRMPVDHRVDIFAAGILLWEMLAGRRLFLGKTDLETFKQVQAADIPDLRNTRPDVTDNLWRVICKALRKDRDRRYQSANDFARDLAVILMQSSNAVTYQDIAKVVTAAAAARASRAKQDKAGLIGELILETLHGFSDAPKLAHSVPEMAAQKPTGSYVDPTAWGLNEVLTSSLPPPAAPPPPRRTRDVIVTPHSKRVGHPSLKPPPSPARADGGPWWRRWFD